MSSAALPNCTPVSERAEKLIKIACPDFGRKLCEAADAGVMWRGHDVGKRQIHPLTFDPNQKPAA